MTIRDTSRRADEQLLRMIAQRCAGVSSYAIAAAEGVRPEKVRVMTTRVRLADEAESGEDVSNAYW